MKIKCFDLLELQDFIELNFTLHVEALADNLIKFYLYLNIIYILFNSN